MDDRDEISAAAEVAQEAVNELLRRIELLLTVIGDKSRCRACGAEIYWVKTRAGKRAPYTRGGISHFADCPEANRFRVGAKEG